MWRDITTEMNTSPYPGSRPSCGGNTATPACLYCTACRGYSTMSLPKALFWQWCIQGREARVFFFLARKWRCWNENAILCYGAPCPPFIGAPCSLLATVVGLSRDAEGGARCIAARMSMDAVHERKADSCSRVPTVHAGRPAGAAEERGGAHGDVGLGA